MTTKDEALKSLHEASLSIACLCADWTEHFVDENNIGLPESLQDINNQKWVLKDVEGLQQDLDHIQNQITILENFLDPDSTYNPYAPKERKMSEVLLALREARETLNRLLEQYPTGFTARRFELNKDLKHIQDQITIIENFLDPFTVEELENQEVQK